MRVSVERSRVLGATAAAAGMLLAGLAPAATAEEATGPAYLDQLGSQLLPLRSADASDIREAQGALTISDHSVLVDVYISGDPEDAAKRLESVGMDVAATGTEPLAVVEGSLPLDSIASAAKLGVTDSVLPVMGGGTDIGAKTSEGVAAHNLPAAIAASGASGAGIDVGVISDSIDTVAGGVNTSQATGDLPPDPNVVVLDDDTTAGTVDEGRAMSEIIYDEAPGLSRILFSTGTESGAVGKAASIDSLVANGADVIADDIFYLSEPFFQDGQVSQAVDRAKAAGVPYFASAGNRARQSYESNYRDSAGLHDFDPAGPVDTRSCFTGTVPTSGFILVVLQWAEPFGAATTDLDLRLTTPAGATLGSAGADDNIVTGIPRETAFFQNLGAAAPVCAEISRVGGVGSPFMKWIEQDNYATPVPEFNTASDTINPDAASANGSLAVAAVDATDVGLNTPESFSSRGPKTRLFDLNGVPLASPEIRFKPNLAAADGASNTVPDFQPKFFGTSAAAPSAAGIAAVLRSANPDATVNEIYAQMTDPLNAIDCTSSAVVPDPDCGAGFILADRAMAALDKTGAVVKATTDPKKPNGKGGFFTKKVSVDWSATDAESPIESTTGCDPVKVTKDGTKTLTCDAVSGGGPGSASVKVKLDTKKPSKPKIKGIKKNDTLSSGDVPPKKKVKCKSKDKGSGIKSCKVKGYSTRPGKHKLKATATDKAGLKSKSSLTYTVR